MFQMHYVFLVLRTFLNDETFVILSAPALKNDVPSLTHYIHGHRPSSIFFQSTYMSIRKKQLSTFTVYEV